MVDFEFTEEQDLFRKAVKEWCEKSLPIEKIREMDTNGEIPQELLRSMGEMGLNIMTAPQEHGGTVADWVTACIAGEELGHADVARALGVSRYSSYNLSICVRLFWSKPTVHSPSISHVANT